MYDTVSYSAYTYRYLRHNICVNYKGCAVVSVSAMVIKYKSHKTKNVKFKIERPILCKLCTHMTQHNKMLIFLLFGLCPLFWLRIALPLPHLAPE